jgi:hypothetical protein
MHLATEICERARLSRDSRFDGQFFVGVRTTGIHCRPICPAPTAKSQNAGINLGRAVRDGDVSLDGTADLDTTLEQLQGLPGIGEWTATYVAMRVLGDPDAFPSTDLGLRKALRRVSSSRPPSCGSGPRVGVLGADTRRRCFGVR